ncbi:MAG: epoxide hydrolase [Sphingomonadales bacterium]|nr:MAG: epoxide hydrolase [Sphingomonadales bacterium]
MVQTFRVAWTEGEIDALKRRLADCPLPPAPDGAGWALGCDRDFLERFRAHWLNDYDWHAAMADLNRYPQFIAEIDGQAIHFVHLESKTANPRPLILTHGWPGSYYEFWGVIERLSDAGFDLVIPSLPGYGFSGKPSQPIGPTGTAVLWHKLMVNVLGYPEYLAQGGDWGSLVTGQIGLNHAGRGVRGIHLNMAGLRSAEPPQNDAEMAWTQIGAGKQQMLGGYASVQMMKPLSIGWLAAGNPLGQAAWILERFHDWADLREGDIESVFGMDHLITNAMLYVMTDSFASSAWFYHGLIREGRITLKPGERCETPTGFAAFPDQLQPPPPRSRIDLCFNLMHWSEPAKGGHFAAMEQPAAFAEDIIQWAEKVWPA